MRYVVTFLSILIFLFGNETWNLIIMKLLLEIWHWLLSLLLWRAQRLSFLVQGLNCFHYWRRQIHWFPTSSVFSNLFTRQILQRKLWITEQATITTNKNFVVRIIYKVQEGEESKINFLHRIHFLVCYIQPSAFVNLFI